MASQSSVIGWVDFSSVERERVSQMLSMLQEEGTLDELGIGQIRDAFSDRLFPGFSTIQTRAKYLVTVPYIFHDYRALSSETRASLSLADYLDQRENELARQLVLNHSEDLPSGIIGKDSLETGVARKPSSVYWNGLRQLSIAKTELSLNEFIKGFEQQTNANYELNEEDEFQHADSFTMTKSDDYASDWMENVRIELTHAEACFLKDKFLFSKSIEHSVPAQLIKHGLLDIVLQSNDELESGVWKVDALYNQLMDSSISEQTKDCLRKALQFSFVLEGAHIRYNMLIAERADNSELFYECSSYQKQWNYEANQRTEDFSQQSIDSWYVRAFTQGKSVNHFTKSFIDNWCQLVQERASEDRLAQCVRAQAIRNKGNRCLLKKALSSQQKWVGMRKLEYRWPRASIILSDMVEGLAKC